MPASPQPPFRRGLRARAWRSLLLTALSLAAAGGCRQAGDDPVIIYLRMGSPIEQEIWGDMFTAISTKFPEIQVKVLNVPYEGYWSKFFTLTASGNPPDLVLMESGYYPGFVEKGALLDLTDLIAQSDVIHLEAYHPTPLQWLTIDGRLYGPPSDTAIMIPFLNLDQFEAAGVPVPGPDWTWEDYLEIARRLTRDTDGDGDIDVYGTAQLPWESVIWSFGGDLVDDPAKPTRCTFDDPLTIKAIQWIADARLKEGVVASETMQTAQIDPFQNGQAAIGWNGHWAVPEYTKRADFKWDVAMLPIGPNGRAIANFGSCFSIPTRARHPEEAWKLLEFLSGAEGSRIFIDRNIMTPALRELAASPAYLDQRPPAHQEYFIAALDHCRSRPQTPAQNELYAMINMELELIWAGEESVQSVCERISAKGTKILNDR